MHVRAERLTDRVTILRVWETEPMFAGCCPPEPYVWACVLFWVADRAVEVKIGFPNLRPSIFRAVLKWMRNNGVDVWKTRRVPKDWEQRQSFDLIIRRHKLRTNRGTDDEKTHKHEASMGPALPSR